MNKCCITDREDVVDDAHITIYFGYGSKRDMQTFNFSPVQEDVAEDILNFIQRRMVKGRSVHDKKFFKDSFDKDSW